MTPPLVCAGLNGAIIGLYRENAIAIESEARDPFGGNVYYVTMQIMFYSSRAICTPLKTDFQLEASPSTTTLCLLSVSHCSIQLIIVFPIPCAFNMSISL